MINELQKQLLDIFFVGMNNGRIHSEQRGINIFMTKQCVGLQLYTIRDETARDFRGALRQVAEMGYQAVEFASYGGIPSKEMALLLNDLGLRAIGSHVGLFLLEQDLEREIQYCLEIGC